MIQTTNFVRSNSNFTHECGMIRGTTLLILGKGQGVKVNFGPCEGVSCFALHLFLVLHPALQCDWSTVSPTKFSSLKMIWTKFRLRYNWITGWNTWYLEDLFLGLLLCIILPWCTFTVQVSAAYLSSWLISNWLCIQLFGVHHSLNPDRSSSTKQLFVCMHLNYSNC